MTLEEFVKGLQLWLVGRLIDDRGAWEFQGIFVSEGEAQARCEGSTWFIAPVTVGEFVPTNTIDWPKAKYPLAQAGDADEKP